MDASENKPNLKLLETEDPTILSGTVRSTLDVFEEYSDADIVCRYLTSFEMYTKSSSMRPCIASILSLTR